MHAGRPSLWPVAETGSAHPRGFQHGLLRRPLVPRHAGPLPGLPSGRGWGRGQRGVLLCVPSLVLGREQTACLDRARRRRLLWSRTVSKREAGGPPATVCLSPFAQNELASVTACVPPGARGPLPSGLTRARETPSAQSPERVAKLLLLKLVPGPERGTAGRVSVLGLVRPPCSYLFSAERPTAG